MSCSCFSKDRLGVRGSFGADLLLSMNINHWRLRRCVLFVKADWQGCLLVTIDAMSSLCVHGGRLVLLQEGWIVIGPHGSHGQGAGHSQEGGSHGIVTQLQREVPSRWDSPKWIWLTSSNTSSVSFATFLSSLFYRQSRKPTALNVLAWIELVLRHSWLQDYVSKEREVWKAFPFWAVWEFQ